MIFDRQQLETFAAAAELRSFSTAAKALRVTRSAVSQRIIALEETLGAPLLVRTGNVPTPAGEALLRHVQMLKVMEAETLLQMKPGSNARTKIAIAVNADSLATWFEPVACDIAKTEYMLELIVDDQDFTLPTLVRGEAIGCVSDEAKAPTGFVADAIGAMEYECVAAPSFRDAYFQDGLSLHAILVAPAVLFNRKDCLHAAFLDRLFGFPVSGYATHYFPSPVALAAAVRAGVGYGLLPSTQARPLVDAGALVSLSAQTAPVQLYWHHWATAPRNARAISDLVLKHAREALTQMPPVSSGAPEESADNGSG